jgi:ADP-ribose pyrophosphatase YjhB (NUDIX family)
MSIHPSEVFKFCPKCGHKGFLFDGVKAFNCELCQFKYYINASGAVAAVLVLPDKKIILTRRKFEPRKGYLDLPGGFIDINESAEKAIIRELKEELGLEIKTMEYLVSFPNQYLYKGITYFTIDMAYICPIDNFSELKPADDVSEAICVLPSEIDYSSVSFPSVISILKKYIETSCNND